MANYTPPEVIAVLDSVDTYLRWTDTNQPPRGHQRYHPSAFGKCLRQMQLDLYHERGWVEKDEEEHEPFLIRIFGTGHAMHDRWRSYFEGLGVLKGYWTCENPFCFAYNDDGTPKGYTLQDLQDMKDEFARYKRQYGRKELQGCFKPQRCCCGWVEFHYDEVDIVDEEMNIYGHCDMILDFSHLDQSKFEGVKNHCNMEFLPKGVVVVDMKTINEFGFKDVANGNPHDYYLVQLTIYANVLGCDYGILIYENKNNSKTCAFKVEKNEETLWPQIRQQAIQMKEMIEVVDDSGTVHHLLPPPRPDDRDSKDCTYCGYKKFCHNSPIWDDPELNEKRKAFYGDLL